MSRPDPASDHFDLLPFIAILMCSLGCLLLVTISTSAISMGIGAPEEWIPSDSEKASADRPTKTPILVEWDGEFASFHLATGRVRGKWAVPQGEEIEVEGHTFRLKGDGPPQTDEAFRAAVASVATLRDTHYVLVAGRPAGFNTLSEFVGEFREDGWNVGFEPVHSGRSVRLQSVMLPANAIGATR